jgi:hypothetical protein
MPFLPALALVQQATLLFKALIWIIQKLDRLQMEGSSYRLMT